MKLNKKILYPVFTIIAIGVLCVVLNMNDKSDIQLNTDSSAKEGLEDISYAKEKSVNSIPTGTLNMTTPSGHPFKVTITRCDNQDDMYVCFGHGASYSGKRGSVENWSLVSDRHLRLGIVKTTGSKKEFYEVIMEEEPLYESALTEEVILSFFDR